MMKFRKKPVVIEAIQYNGSNINEIEQWSSGVVDLDLPHRLKIKTLEGTMVAKVNDWIIRGVKGEYYPCKPDIFEATYEPAEEE